ncbi:MAG: His/Gly/Thr/Pro-type tRNA ligase C-terminal domain-containing protein [Leptospiraceae bacterium]|nr:His/Gly/Thr/Pro-type tRNA ligase C-terminal domain-containing protein [Leptospiraceae bacterium]
MAQDKASIALAEKLREQKISCFIMDKLSKALDYANTQMIPYTIFVGSEELKKKKFKLRDMKTGKEFLLKENELINKLR